MQTLFESIERFAGNQGKSLIKHLTASGINEWHDITKSNLMLFRDHLKDALAPNSAKTLGASLASFLHRFEEDIELPKGFADILRFKGDEVIKTYLSMQEIEQLERVAIKNERELLILNEFLIACKTGARISDVLKFTKENIQDGYLTYVSIKTHKKACVPVSTQTIERIEYIQAHHTDMPRSIINDTLKRLGKRAGINTIVKLHLHGEDVTAPKWQFLSTHYGRISCASIMEELGVSLNDIKLTLGHSSLSMTEHYCKRQRANLNESTLAFFG